ncbi:hypothetical protein RR46_12185 [Papilio xuthus]|uniref:Uncharacterized protein n=1 Tax=Papilio xuthus TaxID=66420 RepID=A0A194PP23_PAPXU|nr:hypothetical protein RR46_12185 [Papilio xuthus]
MTRRKKSKSASSGKDAAAVHAPAQAALATASAQAGAAEPDVTYTVPICPRTGYCLLGPRPVYPILAPRPVQTLSATRPPLIQQGTQPMFATHGPRPMHQVSVPTCSTAARRGTAPRSGAAAQLEAVRQPGAASHSENARRVGNSPQPATARQPVTAATGSQVPPQKRAPQADQKKSSGDLQVKSSAGQRSVTASCDRSSSSSTGRSTRSEELSSAISVASTSTSDFKDKKKPKPYKINVTYETKEINIYPRYPILTVERLRNLEYHVGELTTVIGRRPAVYPLGRRVRFVPETAAEGDTIKRYLARIEAQEGIAWCSYSLPPGNSLKVVVKVKIVERIKIKDDLAKLKQQDEQSGDPAQVKQKDSDAKDVSAPTSVQNRKTDKESSPKEKNIASLSGVKSVSENNIKKLTNSAALNQMTTSNSAAVAKNKPVALTGSVQSTKTNGNINNKNQSAKKARRRGHIQEPKKMTEIEKTAAAVKIVPERDNKLIIVGVQRTNKLLF